MIGISSMVERQVLALSQWRFESFIPNQVGRWCNGNIGGSNPLARGSNPCRPAKRVNGVGGPRAGLKHRRSWFDSNLTHQRGVAEAGLAHGLGP